MDKTYIQKRLIDIIKTNLQQMNPGVTSPIIFNGSEIKLENAMDIKIFSMNGLLIKSAKQANSLYVKDLPKGVYIVKAGISVQKFIVR